MLIQTTNASNDHLFLTEAAAAAFGGRLGPMESTPLYKDKSVLREKERERETRSDSSPHMYMMVVPGATLRPLPRTKSSSSNGCTNFEALKLDRIKTEDKSFLRSDCDSVLVQTSCLKFKMRFLSLLSVV